MASSAQDEPAGFLARWGRRKALVRAGQPVPDVAPAAAAIGEAPPQPESGALHASGGLQQAQAASSDVVESPEPSLPPPPSLADVAALNAGSDYTRFMAQDVDRGVQRAAMKKLFFSDPHFNVMDGLDTYIDDYSRPDPIPLSMLRQMNQSQVLNLFEVEEEPQPQPSSLSSMPLHEPILDASAAPAPLSTPAIDTSSQPDDDNPDLQLQQDHGAGWAGAAKGPGA
ncbi:DUF3306 domain-containing protein [Roseateles sp.]|uniref:DUF3306 domain-containing protein n=1 Tax=Roseateles sp. TaxID=1971397 RepID=UPI003BA6C239